MPDATKGKLTVADLLRAQAGDDYNPLQALAVGAGAATQSGLDQAKHAYLLARLGLANRWQGPEAADAIRGTIGELLQRRTEDARLYQPLREARPYSTAIGEAIPAFTAGRGTGGAAMRWNAGGAMLEDLAPQTIGQMFAAIRSY